MKSSNCNEAKAVLVVFFIIVLVRSTSLEVTSAAPAGFPSLVLPFSLGEKWYICQGYNGWTAGHDKGGHALDLTINSNGFDSNGCAGDINGSAGHDILAPASGTVVYADVDLICLKFDNTRVMMIGHLADRIVEGPVVRNQKLGEVAAAAPINGNYAHIHIQLRDTCANSTNDVPFDSTHGTRLVGGPDLPDVGGVNQHSGQALDRLSVRNKSFTSWIPWPEGWPYLVKYDDDRLWRVSVDGFEYQITEACNAFWVTLEAGNHTLNYWYEPRGIGIPSIDIVIWPKALLEKPVCASEPTITPRATGTPITTPTPTPSATPTLAYSRAPSPRVTSTIAPSSVATAPKPEATPNRITTSALKCSTTTSQVCGEWVWAHWCGMNDTVEVFLSCDHTKAYAGFIDYLFYKISYGGWIGSYWRILEPKLDNNLMGEGPICTKEYGAIPWIVIDGKTTLEHLKSCTQCCQAK